jgi:hypothetical protein
MPSSQLDNLVAIGKLKVEAPARTEIEGWAPTNLATRRPARRIAATRRTFTAFRTTDLRPGRWELGPRAGVECVKA